VFLLPAPLVFTLVAVSFGVAVLGAFGAAVFLSATFLGF
jgi:hypothetical protein